MKKLIPMTDFVLNQEQLYPCSNKKDYNKTNEKVLLSIINYANFLKQPLKLEMFVPCDKKSNVLKKPCGYNNFLEYGINDFLNIEECKKYQQAKKRVLFKGFEFDDIHNWGFSVLYIHPEGTEKVDLCFEDTIEDLFSLCVDFEWELTEEKSRELGL